MNQDLKHERLIEALTYDSDTGFFYRNKVGVKVYKGKQAGRIMRKGYRQLMLDRIFYLEHRLAWFYVYKKWPEFQIDHINEIKTDNRIQNLRDVCQSKNLLNQSKPQKNSSTNLRGVSFSKTRNKYRAQIMISGKQNHLGWFDSAECAYKAYLKAKGV